MDNSKKCIECGATETTRWYEAGAGFLHSWYMCRKCHLEEIADVVEKDLPSLDLETLFNYSAKSYEPDPCVDNADKTDPIGVNVCDLMDGNEYN